MGVPKFPNLGLPQLWGPITFFLNLWLIWGLKKSCRSLRELSNSMWHATCTHGNWVDSWLLVVGSQTANLTPGPSFDHNLCFRCPNGSWDPMNIYTPRAFQWYKEHLNLMNFDPYNRSLKIQESTGIPTPKVGVPLGVWGFIPSHSFALPGAWNVTPRLPSWPALLQALALVASPKLRLWQYCCSINVVNESTNYSFVTKSLPKIKFWSRYLFKKVGHKSKLSNHMY
jgi:hypothetical protein